MKKTLSLSITNPCSEKWETFSSTANGRFCGSCSKVVIDFTTMSDEEIIHFINQKPTHACGRFHADQLKTYVVAPEIKINPGLMLLKAGFFSLVFLLVAKPTSAQIQSEKVKTEVIDQRPSREARHPATTTEHSIKGIVLSGDDGLALTGVNVVLQGSAVGTTTDSEGRFEFPQKVKEGDVLLFSFIGLKTEEYKVPKHINDPFEIRLKMDFEIMGELVVNDSTHKSSSVGKWLRKIKNLF